MLPLTNNNQSEKSKIIFNKIVSLILGFLGIVVMIIIIGGGALLAGHFWNPPWNPFYQTVNSDKIIREKILQQIKR